MKTNNIKLNCDMGESFNDHKVGMDEEIMPYIDMANLACGFHASEPVTMHRSIKLAKTHDVTIGAHPSYPDLEGFGRREMDCSIEEIVSLVLYQCGALDGICRSYGEKVSYLKPHGALYNTMMKDIEVFKAICKAISKYTILPYSMKYLQTEPILMRVYLYQDPSQMLCFIQEKRSHKEPNCF